MQAGSQGRRSGLGQRPALGRLWFRFLALLLLAVLLSGFLGACTQGLRAKGSGNLAAQPSGDRQKPDVELTLAAFVVTKAAHEAVIPKFVDYWQRTQKQQVRFNRSYGGSGSQARAVVDGLDADVVHLALGLDVQRLEKAGLIASGWQQEWPNRSIVSRSVPVIVTRPGNPKGIQDWSDLLQPGIRLITADPQTSGVARWNFLALWNAALRQNPDPTKARDFVAQVYRNAPILTRDAREATDVFFKQQQGDALINYENELILAAQRGIANQYVVPQVNISIDNPVAIVDRNVDRHRTREVAEAFVKFLFTPEAQQEFARVGFRPVESAILQNLALNHQFPTVQYLSTVQDFGGWDAVQKSFFADGAIFDQIRVKLESN